MASALWAYVCVFLEPKTFESVTEDLLSERMSLGLVIYLDCSWRLPGWALSPFLLSVSIRGHPCYSNLHKPLSPLTENPLLSYITFVMIHHNNLSCSHKILRLANSMSLLSLSLTIFFYHPPFPQNTQLRSLGWLPYFIDWGNGSSQRVNNTPSLEKQLEKHVRIWTVGWLFHCGNTGFSPRQVPCSWYITKCRPSSCPGTSEICQFGRILPFSPLPQCFPFSPGSMNFCLSMPCNLPLQESFWGSLFLPC